MTPPFATVFTDEDVREVRREAALRGAAAAIMEAQTVSRRMQVLIDGGLRTEAEALLPRWERELGNARRSLDVAAENAPA